MFTYHLKDVVAMVEVVVVVLEIEILKIFKNVINNLIFSSDFEMQQFDRQLLT